MVWSYTLDAGRGTMVASICDKPPSQLGGGGGGRLLRKGCTSTRRHRQWSSLTIMIYNCYIILLRSMIITHPTSSPMPPDTTVSCPAAFCKRLSNSPFCAIRQTARRDIPPSSPSPWQKRVVVVRQNKRAFGKQSTRSTCPWSSALLKRRARG